jgi:hypothetical protein
MIKISRNTFIRQASQSNESFYDFVCRLAKMANTSTALLAQVSDLPAFVVDGDSPSGLSTYGELMVRGVKASDVAAKLSYTINEWKPSVLMVFPLFDPACQHLFNSCVNNRVPMCIKVNLPVIKFYTEHGGTVYTVGFEDKSVGTFLSAELNPVVLMWQKRLAQPSAGNKASSTL